MVVFFLGFFIGMMTKTGIAEWYFRRLRLRDGCKLKGGISTQLYKILAKEQMFWV